MNSLLFENLQLMHESKFNRKIMKEVGICNVPMDF